MKKRRNLSILCFFSFISLFAQVQAPKLAADALARIAFEVVTEKQSLRAAPDATADVVVELNLHTQLAYLHETKGAEDELDYGGQKIKARWYKVRIGTESMLGKEGWVHGGAVALRTVLLPETLKPNDVSEDFLEVQKIGKIDFERAVQGFKPDFVVDSVQITLSEIAFALNFNSNRRRIFLDTIPEEDWAANYRDYNYIGRYPGLNKYLVEIAYDAWITMLFLDVDSGQEQRGEPDANGIPVASPDKKWLAGGNGNVEDKLGGLQIYSLQNRQIHPAFTFLQGNKTTGRIAWTEKPNEFVFEWQDLEAGEEENKPAFYRMRLR